jgi:hypothetical protein
MIECLWAAIAEYIPRTGPQDHRHVFKWHWYNFIGDWWHAWILHFVFIFLVLEDIRNVITPYVDPDYDQRGCKKLRIGGTRSSASLFLCHGRTRCPSAWYRQYQLSRRIYVYSSAYMISHRGTFMQFLLPCLSRTSRSAAEPSLVFESLDHNKDWPFQNKNGRSGVLSNLADSTSKIILLTSHSKFQCWSRAFITVYLFYLSG